MSQRFTNPNELETFLRSTPLSIQPSADLRSNILEAAVQHESDRTADQRLSLKIFCLFSLLFASAITAHYAYLSWSDEVGEHADRRIYSLSERISREKGLRAEASFLEAFWETRQNVAERFPNSSR